MMNTTVRPAPTAWIQALLAALGSGHREGSKNWQCPAHPDATPSLGLVQGRNGAAVTRCLRGCETRAIVEALGLRMHHLYSPPAVPPDVWAERLTPRPTFPPLAYQQHPTAAGFRLENVHPYGDDFRLLRYRHPGTGRKSLEWERRSQGCWVPGLGGTPLSALPLYRAREARMAVGSGELLVIVESESSVDALAVAGIYATTWAGGASTPQLHRLRALRNATRLLLCPDNDSPGIICARRILAILPNARTLLPSTGADARDILTDAGADAFIRGWARNDHPASFFRCTQFTPRERSP